MRTTAVRVRNTAFFVMLAAALLGVAAPHGWVGVPGTLFGVPGLIVMVLTFWVGEPAIQKIFFVVTGGSAGGLFITLAVFSILRMLGRTPGGDGGGPTVGLILTLTPLFIVGAIGSTVCLIKGSNAEPPHRDE